MAKVKVLVLWSMRGRYPVEVEEAEDWFDTKEAAEEEFERLMYAGAPKPEEGDCDGYEIDDIEEV